MLRFGPADGPVIVVAQPLFEEANRTRALIVAVLRGLAQRNIASVLPDVPGQGESETDLQDVSISDWQEAFSHAAASLERPRLVAFRGGALVASEAPVAGRLLVAPVVGRTLVRDLMRARRAAAIGAGERPVADDLEAEGPSVELAGNLMSRSLLRGLMTAEPPPADHVIGIFPDGGEADIVLAPPDDENCDARPRFTKPWAASEPVADAALAEALTNAIADWMAICAA